MTTIMTIEKYREILNDYKTEDEVILQKLEYLEAFCRNIIKTELEKFTYSNV